jgi:hypothetical protein
MSLKPLFVRSGLVLVLMIAPGLRADVLEMQNGDRYSGKVISVSSATVVMTNEVLGQITVPRGRVASLSIGTNTIVPQTAVALAPPVSTNLSAVTTPAVVANTNMDLPAAFRQLGANTNFVGQIRQQMLAGNPEAVSKYNELVNGLLSGRLSVGDIRQQAQSAAAQLRDMKRELGPEADEALDGYLQVLDSFIKETANEPAAAAPPQSP